MPVGWAIRSCHAWKKLLSGDAKYWVISAVGVQGSAYLAQILLARTLTADGFGVARTAESYLGILAIIGTLGVPSAAYRSAALSTAESRDAALTQALFLTLLASVLAAISFLFLLLWVPALIPKRSASVLLMLLPVIVTGSLVRTATAFLQGELRLRKLALISIIPAGLTCILIPVVVPGSGLNGWVFVRNAVEACALILVLLVAGSLTFRGWVAGRSISNLKIAIPSLIGLSLDKAASVADMLVLEKIGWDYAEVGSYGAATVMLLAMTIPAGAKNALAFAGLVQAGASLEPMKTAIKQLVKDTLILVGPIAVLLALGGTSILRLIVGPQYGVDRLEMSMLAVTILLRVVLSNFGSLALALGMPGISAWGNLVGLIVVVGVATVLIPHLGLAGAALGALCGTLARLLVYVLAIKAAVPPTPGASGS